MAGIGDDSDHSIPYIDDENGDHGQPDLKEKTKQSNAGNKFQDIGAQYGVGVSMQSSNRQESGMNVGDDMDVTKNNEQKAIWNHKGEGARPKTGTIRKNTTSHQQDVSSMIEHIQTSEKLNHQMPVFRAWTNVNLSFSYMGQSCVFDATNEIEPCKLQFAIESPKQARSFAYKLRKKSIKIVCLGPGSVAISMGTDNFKSNETLISEVTEGINTALKDVTVTSLDFDSEHQAISCLENLGHECKSLLSDMIVGLFFTNTQNFACLSLVGTSSEIDSITEDIQAELILLEKDTKQKQIIELPSKNYHRVAQNSVGNSQYIDRKEYDIHTIHFLDQIGFKKTLAESCPRVQCAELEPYNNILQFTGPTKEEVEKAENILDNILQRVIKESINLPFYVIEFFKQETVFLHLQRKLRPFSSSVEVTDCVVVWANDRTTMDKSKDVVMKSYTVEASQAQILEHEHLNSLLKEGHGKVKIYTGEDGKSHICYLNDEQGLAKQIKEFAKTDDKIDLYDKIGKFDKAAIQLMLSINISHKLEKAFPGVTFSLDPKSCEVKVTSKQKQKAEDAFKELQVYERRLGKVSLNDIPQNIKHILQRPAVQDVVAEMLKKSFLVFLNQDTEFICIGIDLGKTKDLRAAIESCFEVKKGKRELLDTEKGKEFLNQHALYLCREDLSDTVSTIICTKDLAFKLHIFFEECEISRHYEKQCKQITLEFLKTHGKHFVRRVEEKHKVEIVFKDSSVVFNGNFNDGENAMQELVQIVPTGMLCLENGERYLETKELKTAIDDIAESYECCWSMTSQINDRDDASSCIDDKGIFQVPETLVEITQSPLFEVGGECLVVAVSSELNLSDGYLCDEVSKRAGKELQTHLKRCHSQNLLAGDTIMTPAYNLEAKGIKKLIFGHLPKWKKNGRHLKILGTFVQDCLVEAEQSGCKSVVFPALGTGKLKYPKRDVAKVMLDGIENYLSKTRIGDLAHIYISCPTFEMDTTMFQLLVMEQKKRHVFKDIDEETSLLETYKDETKLVFSDAGIKFAIVKEDVLQFGLSNEFLHVEFTPADEVIKPDLSWSNWKLIVGCGRSLADLQGAMQCVICACEENLITSIYVLEAKGFEISFAEQTDVIVKSVHTYKLDSKSHSREFRYLSNVTIVTDEAGYANIENKSLTEQPQQGWFGRTFWKDTHGCVWTKESLLCPRQSLLIRLIGISKDSVDAAKKEISHLLQVNGKEEKLIMPQKQREEVTAEINQGIVKYLKGKPEYFNKWKGHIENVYHVKIKDHNYGFEMKVIGSFENILKLEKYFEKGSFDLPEEAEEQVVDFEHNHYKAESNLVEFKSPIHPNNLEILMTLFSAEIQSLTEDNKITGIRTTKEGIYIKCIKGQEPHVKSVFFNMKNKLETTYVRSISFESDVEFDFAVQECFAKCPKYAKYIAEKSERKIKIFGNEKAVTGFIQALHPEMDGLPKETNKLKRERYQFKIKGITCFIYCDDILDSNVDCLVSASNSNLMCRYGIAKSIAEKAGPEFLRDCKETVENNGELFESECRATTPGKLHFTKILNVHSLIKHDSSQIHTQLPKIQKAVSNALEKAELLEVRSIGFPFICSGTSGFSIEMCAQQYIRGIEEHCKNYRRGNVLEVHFVDKDKKKVESVSKIFKEYIHTRFDEMVHVSKQLKYKFPQQDLEVSLGYGRIAAVEADGVVAFIDRGFKEDGIDVTDILRMSCDNFKQAFKREQDKHHDITSVTVLTPGSRMKCQHILFAVPPGALASKQNDFERDLRITFRRILEESTSKGMTSLALPLPFVEGNDSIMKAYCTAIRDEITTYFQHSKSSLKKILIVSSNIHMMSEVNREIEQCFETTDLWDTRNRH